MVRVAYIAGTGHCGSTLLSVWLSKQPTLYCVGEVAHVINKRGSTLENVHEVCSCGSSLDECVFWGPLVGGEGSFCEQYKRIVSAVPRSKEVVVDSTKGVIYLEKVADCLDDNFHVLILARDIRSYAVSAVGRARAGGSRYPAFLTYLFYFRQWLYRYRFALDFVRERNIPFLVVSYENFCHDTQGTLDEITAFLGVDRIDLGAEPQDHIAYSNRMKVDGNKRSEVRYDDRWLKKKLVKLYYYLYPGARKWNERLVY